MFESIEDLFRVMLKGDTKCSIPLNSRVMKGWHDDSDKHKTGDKGVVKGSIFVEGVDCYLVKFEDSVEEQLSFVANKELNGVKRLIQTNE